MKKIILIACYCCIAHLAFAQVVNKGTIIKISSGMTIKANDLDVKNTEEGNLNNEGEVITSLSFLNETDGVVDGSGIYTIGENFTNSATFTADNSTVVFSEDAASMLTSNGNPFYNIQINKASSSDVSFMDNITVDNSLDFMGDNNKVNIGSNTLSFSAAAAITGYDDNDYIVTNSTGVVAKDFAGSSFYPVGYDNATYNPVELTNQSGISGVFNVRCLENAYRDGLSGAAETEKVADVSWDITSAESNISLDVTLQWSASDELTLFSRGVSRIYHYTGGSWDAGAYSAASGSGPYTQTSTGYTSLSPFTVGSDGALPLELLSFKGTAKKRSNFLEWETEAEEGVSHFEIQRSPTGFDFARIGEVQAKGTATSINHYDFNDYELLPLSYYRLKIMDETGDFEYSNTITLKRDDIATGIYNLFPNPAKNSLQVFADVTPNTQVSLEINDQMGRVLRTQQFQSNDKGEFKEAIDISQLAQGVYHVIIKHAKTISSSSFSIVK